MSRNNGNYNQMGIDSYAKAIREALNENNSYEERLELTIHMLACSLSVYKQIKCELDKDSLLKVERIKGQDRYKTNPLFPMLINAGEQIRKYLRELKLTKALSGKNSGEEEEGESDLSELVGAVRAAGLSLGPRLPEKDHGSD